MTATSHPDDANSPVRLGMITPSCNTALEPFTHRMAAALPRVSVHFARLRVEQISLADESMRQFAEERMLDTARLLADARVGCIAWNGTSGSWTGLDHDRAICRGIEREVGIAATSAALAIEDALSAAGIRRIGLYSPYTGDVQDRIIAQLQSHGYACPAEHHLGSADGFAFGQVSEEEIEAGMRRLAADGVDAIVVMCTNLRGSRVGAAVEADTGVLVIDSIAAVLWRCLALAGVDSSGIVGYGRIFALPAP